MIKLQAIKNNQFAKFQLERIGKNEKEILYLQNSFENWMKVQKSWVYLEPIYTQDDVAKNLRDEKKIFDEVNTQYKKIMQENTGAYLTDVQDFCRSNGFSNCVKQMLIDFEMLDKCLNDYLDKKSA